MKKNKDNEKTNDLLLAQRAESARGTIFGICGQDEDDKDVVLNFNADNALGNKNVIVFGGTGSGKTTCFSHNYIFQAIRRRESVVVVETKEECRNLFWDFAEEQGYVQKCLNLKDFKKSDGWNVLETCIGEKSPSVDAELMANLIITNLAGSNTFSDIYHIGPTYLLKAILLRIICGNDFNTRIWGDSPLHIDELPVDRFVLSHRGLEGPKTMKSVCALLMHPEGYRFLEEFFNKEVLEHTGAMEAYGPFMSFKQGSPNLLGNIMSNLTIQLQALMNEEVQNVLSKDDIDLELPGKRPCIYYCEIPDTYKNYNYIAALFVNMLYFKMTQLADMQFDRKVPVPVNFLLEDFTNLGFMPGWDNKCSLSNSRDINIAMILNDVMQLRQVYDKAQSDCILNSCGAVLSFASASSKVNNWSTAPFGKTFFATNFAEKKTSPSDKPFINPDEIRYESEDDVVLVMQNQQPLTLKKFHYTQHPLYKTLLQAKNVQNFNGDESFETAKVVSIEDAADPIYGMAGRDAKNRPFVLTQNMDAPYGNQNVLVVGNEASGKTTAYNMNDILQVIRRNESAVIADPRGKMYQTMADYAKSQGYIVRVLDLQDLSHSDGWDLLNTSLSGNTTENAYTAAHVMLRNCKQQNHNSLAGYQLLAEEMIKRFEDMAITPEQKTISAVYDDIVRLIDRQAEKNETQQENTETLSCMFDPYVDQLKRKLLILKDETTREVLSTDDIDLELPGKQKCMYFILPPTYMSDGMFIAPLFLEMLYAHLADYAETQESGLLPVRVNFILDEFPWLGVLPDWEKKLALCRSKNIRISITTLDFDTIKRRYGDMVAESIVGNCSTWLFLDLLDDDCRELIEAYCEYNEADDIDDKIHRAQEDDDLVLILFVHHEPILMKKLYFEDHPDYKKLHKKN